jgi:GT2 family glycosyltransferase
MKNRCFFIREQPMNSTPPNRIAVRRTAALGDVLSASVVINKLIERGYDPLYECHSACHCIMRRHPRLQHLREPGRQIGQIEVNLDGVYEKHPLRRQLHLSSMWLEAANAQLGRLGINLGPALNCKPVLRVHQHEKAAAMAQFAQYPRPWVFICPRSDAYACRQVPDGIWHEAAKKMQGTKFWLGRHPAPAGIVDLKAQHVDNVIIWLSAADLLVTVDTGPMHIAAALGIPIVALGQSSSPELHLNDQTDFITINCQNLDCLNCQKNICPINPTIPPCQNFSPDYIAQWVNAKLRQKFSDRISAVVPIYQPDAGTLNRCLECLLPQVDEIIVTEEGGNSRRPANALKHPKIRYVVKGLKGIGYGRNFNFGARHTTGKYILHLNDDVFLLPGAVAGLKAALKPGVGMTCGILRWPDGLIYHAGKRRAPGQRGFGHIDCRQRDCTTNQDTEMENLNTACVLTTREAHFGCGCFDEEFFVYSDDDAYCLQMRRAGWKLMFTPVECGTHLEHQSTSKLGNIMDVVAQANVVFTRKWGWYYDRNLQTIPGTFD